MSQSKGIRVLLVEDNQVDIELLRLAFSQDPSWQVEIIVAEDGEKAINLLQHCAAGNAGFPDFIVLDLNVPRRDGVEVLKAVRALPEVAAIPVAILSSSPRDFVYTKLAALGITADGHFVKPMDLDAFLALGSRLHAWFDERHATREPNF